MDRDNETFWQFSNRFYRDDAVAHNCLQLQDELGADVNLLLFAYWYGLRYGVLPEPTLRRAMENSRLWSESCVQPLRQARRRMKQPQAWLPSSLTRKHHALREQIKQLELEAEHLQQDMLQSLAETPAPAGSRAHAEANLRGYLAALMRSRSSV